jgi:RimJ/RimL family protein N-acetyltransferase
MILRPLACGDEAALCRFFRRLSPRTVYLRYGSPIPASKAHLLLAPLTRVDHDKTEAVVAERRGEIVAVARYARLAQPSVAEIAVVVEDAHQGRGLANRLLRDLSTLAAQRGIERFTATMLGENAGAVRLIRRLAPQASVAFKAGEFVAEVRLSRLAAASSYRELLTTPR